MVMESLDDPLEQSPDDSRWEVWRQDDNGNRFRVDGFSSPGIAGEHVEELEERGHKQIYWVKDRDTPDREHES